MAEEEMAGWHHRLDGRVWVNSGSWWWTGRPGVLWFMGSQRVWHDWATKLNWTEYTIRASLVAQTVKNLLAMWETQVWSLGQEDPLEKGMATHSSILASRIPWTDGPGMLQSMESQRISHYLATNTFTLTMHCWCYLSAWCGCVHWPV